MGGPSVSRSDVNTAPLPGLTNPYQGLLAQLFGFQPQTTQGTTVGQSLQNLPPYLRNMFSQQQQQQVMPGTQQTSYGFNPNAPQAQQFLQNLFSTAQPSGLQQQVGNTYANQLSQPTAQQRTFETALPQIQQLLGGLQSGYGDILKQTSPQGILDASQPVFQRNLQLGADTLRQAGPRFASNTERLVQQQGTQAMQDYNLFAQQAIQNAMGTRLGALGGLAQGTLGGFQTLGGLGQGADASILNLLGGAGGFGNQLFGQLLGQQGMNQQALMQMLGLGAQVGTGPAALVQNPGGFANFASLLGGGGALGMGLFGQGGPFASKPRTGGLQFTTQEGP